ncbi:MAG: sugar-binding domain-containing protein [Actinomycetota bacterium]
MVSTVLSGPWRGASTTDELRRDCIDATFDDADWLDMSVPGHWSEHDRLASRRSVLYRTTFPLADNIAGGRHWVVFDGIWQSADVWLNGHYLGPTDGWFTPHEFEITEFVADRDEHVLVVEVMAPAPPVDEPSRSLNGIFDDSGIVGHANRGGIWRPVRIVSTGPVRMTKKRLICTEANAEAATLHFRCHVLSDESRPATIVTTVRPPGGGPPIIRRQDHALASGSTVLEWDVRVADPELWWPWELGDQPLYRVTVSVEVDDSISGIWDRTVGLRTVEMKNWILSINGERIFARGADLWPTDALPADSSPERLAGDIELARDLGLNLLRLESHVARPELYDAADRAGVMLWQDLPLRGEVKRTVQGAAVDASHRLVDQLGAHPSIVVWCAHYDSTGTTTGPRPATAIPSRRSLFGVAKQQAPTWTKSVLDRLVGRAFRRADGSRPVIESSGTWPSAPFFNGMDTHLRFGWNSGTGRDLEVFARRIPRMVRWVSSLGAQSIPDHPAVAVRNWPADLNLLAERYGLVENGFRQYLPLADYANGRSWIAASQAYQATLLRRQIETLRRLKYKPSGGFTFAALADSRPAISFAIHDHDRNPKQAAGAVRAACRPVIVVSDRLPTEMRPGDAVLLDVHVVNDERVPHEDLVVTAELHWPGGQHRWAWRGSVEADAIARIGSINWIVPDIEGPVSLHLQLCAGDVELADNHYQGAITHSL